MDRLIFHIDVNSAFLSWEATKRVQNGEPDLRLIPSVVGGDPSKRTSIVTAKSIPAKKYGINTGEPVSMALRKCPELVIVRGDFALYEKYSKAFKAICKEYTSDMESFSIDEVFLDMSGMSKIFPDPIKTAHEIKDRIRDELGFTVNVGIGKNKLCAKMASDFEKPDKVHTLFPEEIHDKMWPLPVVELFTCGKASAARLNQIGINTIGELASMDEKLLVSLFGEAQGTHLHRFANGIDDSPVVEEEREAKGFSAETTVEEDLVDLEVINSILLAQADVVCQRMRAEEAKASCVHITYRTINFQNKTHQRKLLSPTDVTEEVYKVATELVKECWNSEPLRLIGLGVTDISRDGFDQFSLFDDDKKEKLRKLDSAMDSIRKRFGNDSVQRAGTIESGRRVARKYKAVHNGNNENN